MIDWEYAAAGDPSLDLALTINANGLDMESAVAAYCQLRGKQDSDRWLAAVTAWLRGAITWPCFGIMSVLLCGKITHI